MIQIQAQAARDLIETLVSGGVREAVISPGSRNTPLVLAAHACEQLRCYVAIDERVAGFMALGMSRLHGRPPLLICTSGSALAHYAPAVLEANAARLPMMILSASRPEEKVDCGAPQALNQKQVFDGYIRWFKHLPIADERGAQSWSSFAVAGLAACWGSPEGPVHLDCPFREPLWQSGLETTVQPASVVLPATPRCDPSVYPSLASRLSRKKGLVICGPMHGSSTHDDRLASALRALVSALGWPIFAEPASRLRGRCGEYEVPYLERLLEVGFLDRHSPDVVVQLGTGLTSKSLRAWLGRRDGDHLMLDRDGLWNDPTWRADALVVGDESDTLDGLCAQRLDPAPPDWLHRWQQVTQCAESSLDRSGWSEATALGEVVKHFDVVQIANSLPVRHLEGFVSRQHMPETVLCNRGLNGIDGTIATALGACAASGQRTLVVVGDVAFVHDLGALAQAVGDQADLCILVIDNGGGGIFRRLPISDHEDAFSTYFETPPAIDLLSIAQGLGMPATRVTNTDALAKGLPSWLNASGPRVLIAKVHVDDEKAWTIQVEQAFRRAMVEFL